LPSGGFVHVGFFGKSSFGQPLGRSTGLSPQSNVALEAIGPQTRHILDTLDAKGLSIHEICIRRAGEERATRLAASRRLQYSRHSSRTIWWDQRHSHCGSARTIFLPNPPQEFSDRSDRITRTDAPVKQGQSLSNPHK
jgi:hypothetical protein